MAVICFAANTRSTDSLDHWVASWGATFDHIIRLNDDVVLVSYELLWEDGVRVLRGLADCLNIEQAGLL